LSQIIPGIPLRGLGIFFYVHPKSNDHINNDRRTHRKKRNINKPHTDATGGDTQSFTNSGTNSERLPLDECFYSVHFAKIIFFDF